MKMETSSLDERPKWGNKVQYMLTSIGYAVGLGNVWRFPYLCQIYGGGAFLIPYFVALKLLGLPLLFLELAIGQRLRMGNIGVWNSISPFLGGVGIACMIGSFLIALFYNNILAWVLWYLIHSFEDPLPWSQCPLNDNLTSSIKECVDSTPVNYFWYRETLNITTDIEESGGLQWWLVLCEAAAWFILCICVIRGIQSMGKAVYVTSTLPYVVLTIFLVRGLTLPGATDGLIYLFTPDWEVLKNPQVWLDAATQIFFSLGVASGGLTAFSSYNPEKNNCERDAVLVGVINSATSLYAAISVFSIMGFKAKTNFNACILSNILLLINKFDLAEQAITPDNYDEWLAHLNSSFPEDVASLDLKHCDMNTFLKQSASGPGLAFIVFSEAVTEMPGSQIWAVLFYFMLFLLGLGSMFGTFEAIVNPLREMKLEPKWMPKGLFTALVCIICCSISLIFTMGSGSYWLEIFNSAISAPLLIIGFFEIIGVIYVRGMKSFSKDIYLMTGRRPNIFWKACWTVISPVLLFVAIIAYVFTQSQTRPSYPAWDPDYENFPQAEAKPYPDWVFGITVLLYVAPVLSIPLVALRALYRWLTLMFRKERNLNPQVNDAFDLAEM